MRPDLPSYLRERSGSNMELNQHADDTTTPPLHDPQCQRIREPHHLGPALFVSSRFNLDSWDMHDADVLFLTPDQVFFYAHQSTILSHSTNSFGGLLADSASYSTAEEVDTNQPMSESHFSSEPRLVVVNIPSDIFNVVLLALYRFPIHEYSPSIHTLRETIPTLVNLGCDPSAIASPRSELYGLLLKSAAVDSLSMYAVAAQCYFEALAVSVSALTLRISLDQITDDLALQMGPIYLRRLFFLHLGRADALRRIILPLPNLHPPEESTRCSIDAQKGILRAWTLASAYMIAQNHPGDIQDMVSLLGTHVECTTCGRSLQERISRLVHDWSAVKYTI
ncbi:hypothetical protein RHS01_06030 [Rhizoctonia solani]|uniref:Uncharacterized protein n=1 Tax=Rhizoctonia solani TaxID=456999 RepID=A0A8H7IAY6_9AGAM|nr:hypothetical protein RHS01_06030 [Rhizoctonia solani]